jgi:hypothetical protein
MIRTTLKHVVVSRSGRSSACGYIEAPVEAGDDQFGRHRTVLARTIPTGLFTKHEISANARRVCLNVQVRERRKGVE